MIYMKKIMALLVAATASITMAASSFAAAPTVYLNGEKMTFDAEPFIQDDRTFVPLRAIFEAVGASVIWDQDTLTVLATKAQEGDKDDSSVVVQINNPTAFVNSEAVELDAPARVINDRTFVPLRFVVESLGEKVDWNQEELRVDITTGTEADKAEVAASDTEEVTDEVTDAEEATDEAADTETDAGKATDEAADAADAETDAEEVTDEAADAKTDAVEATDEAADAETNAEEATEKVEEE